MESSSKRNRSRALVALLAVALVASSSIASCGVMFGAEEANLCAEQSCTLPSECPITSCLCDDGVSRSVNSCITEKSCCSKASFACEALCEPYGGWSGQADAGFGGSGGSAGRGGSGGTSGSAGTSGRGGTSGLGGMSGSGGSAGFPVLGQSCTGTLSVSCGCSSTTDTVCNQVLLCGSPAAAGRWTEGTQCGTGVRCFMNPGRSTAACGTNTLYLPYAEIGGTCASPGDTFACSIDRRSSLSCAGGRWQLQDSCPSLCTTFQGGTTRCMSTTSFCVGCQ